MNDDIVKKKNELMKAVMMNPKLSKSFKEAMNAPIGSTKREQVKSILSIMKKVGGVRNDGMGGPGMMGVSNQGPKPSIPSAPDYSNMIIFPAAPKFKVKAQPQPEVAKPKINDFDGAGGTHDGQGGLIDTISGALNKATGTSSNISTTPKPTVQPKTYPSFGEFTGVNKLFTVPDKYKQTSTPSTLNRPDYSNFDIKQVGSNIVNTIKGQPLSQPASSIPKTSTSVIPPLVAASKTPVVQGPMSTDKVTQPLFDTKTGAPIVNTGSPQANNTQTNNTQTGPKTNTSVTTGAGKTTSTGSSAPAPTMSEGDRLRSEAQSAVNQGTGPGLFAMAAANEKFGGSLDQYVADLDAKLKKDFNLESLETELSDLKSMKDNLVPTLTQYIQGKDQYLKFIDKMIDSTEDDLLSVDMSDPASVDRYNNYTNYLYTLKGRQTQRYGNFLNSAISDYNAELDQTQTNYDNIYQRYSDAITRQGGIAQNEYNTLYGAMADLYTNLEQAPIKRANLEALQLQNIANRMTIAQNGVKQGTVADPDYFKHLKTYQENITDKDGNLSKETLGEGGIPGLFAKVAYSQGNPYAMAEAINTAMAKSISSGGLPKVQEFKTLINDLNSVEGGSEIASMLSPSLAKNSKQLVSDYVLSNLSEIKKATNHLVSGTAPWFAKNKKPGIEDKEGWMNSYKGLDKGVLEGLYNTAKYNITPGSSYEKSPSTFVSTLFSGPDDKSTASNIASTLVSF